MGVNLSKGQKVDLTKGNPGLSKLLVGLGWDVKKYDGGYDFDLDAAAFLLGKNGKVISDADFVFYNNLKHDREAYSTWATTSPERARATTSRF